ncbi:hypothetical protein FKP32DRAFT_1620029 [Trametes sanguinea]|nr:hypothetical protein FKP32DRAFT_1620029 [Trametes sanguinea]
MAHRCARRLRLAPLSSWGHVRYLHSTAVRMEALALPPVEAPTSASTSSTPRRESPHIALRNQKISELLALLEQSHPNPQHVWSSYVDLLHAFGRTKVPLDIHQRVLRRCAPSAAHIRLVFGSRQRSGFGSKIQLYETRYREVIRNIRAAGDIPDIEDYHCVLAFYAAYGNYHNALMVFAEVADLGLDKTPQTYNLCLQALAQRLSQPVWHQDRPQLVSELTRHLNQLLSDMSQHEVPYTAPNVDLAFRILKETLDMEGFSALMRNAYGIDLAYPDRSPLMFWSKKNVPGSAEVVPADTTSSIPTRLPFTLSAFNTALDYLGRAREVSKMVQLFEVVTNPLPSSTSNRTFDDDDDDDDFGVSNPQVAPFTPPHVRPTTATFHILLRSLHLANHAVLARHYLLLALDTEKHERHALHLSLKTKPPNEVRSPRIAITRNFFLPVFSIANDNKRVELMRWTLVQARRAVKWKQRDLDVYRAVRAQWAEQGWYQPLPFEPELEELDDLPLGLSPSSFSTFFDPSSSPGSTSTDVAPPKKPRQFHIDYHIALMRRELDRLLEFLNHAETVYQRTVQRVKERLGRRVWGEKDVFMRDANDRVVVSKERWRAAVNFRPRSENPALQDGRSSRMSPAVPPPATTTPTTSPIRQATLGAQPVQTASLSPQPPARDAEKR